MPVAKKKLSTNNSAKPERRFEVPSLSVGPEDEDTFSIVANMNNGYLERYRPIRTRIYYKNLQWAVTSFGLQNVCGPIEYDIAWAELDSREKREDRLRGMCEKRWVDQRAFYKALKFAERRLKRSGGKYG